MQKNQKIILTNSKLPSKTRLRLLHAIGTKFVLRHVNRISKSELGRVEILLVDILPRSGRRWLATEKVARLPHLKLIQSSRAGVDAIDFRQLPESVKICGNIGAYSDPIAEHAIGMILYFAKDLANRNNSLKRGTADMHNSLFLKGKTLAVVGAGGIGKAIAKIGKSLGMKTLGVNTSGKHTRYFDETFRIGELNKVLRASDVVVLSLPLTTRSFHIIDAKKLRIMKKKCILVNVARGHVINENDLYKHLVQNPEFKCGLDVWWHYPKAGGQFFQKFPFFSLPNFLGTPHVSGYVPEEREIALDFAVDNIVRFVKDRQLRGLVNRKDYRGLRELIMNSKTS